MTAKLFGVLVAMVLVTGFAFETAAQQQVTGSGQFCVKGPTGPVRCEFQTMAQCAEKRPPNDNDRCIARSEIEKSAGGATSGSPQREPAPAPGSQKD